MIERDKKDVKNEDLYYMLGQIDGKLDGMLNQQSKVIYALIALAGATLGLKLMGTPPLVVISRFINMFVFFFTAIVGFSLRKKACGWYFILVYGIGGVVGNLISLIGGENLTSEFRIPVFVAANLSLFLYFWRQGRQGVKQRE
jgi:hypothetical protein